MSYKASRNDGDQTVKLYLNAEDIQYNAQTEAVTIRPRVRTVFSSAQDELDNSAGYLGGVGKTGFFSVPKGTMGIKVNMSGSGRLCKNIDWGQWSQLIVYYYDMTIRVALLDASDNELTFTTFSGSYSRESAFPYYHNFNWSGTLTFNANLAPEEATPYRLEFTYISAIDTDEFIESAIASEDLGILSPEDKEKYSHPQYFFVQWGDLILTLPTTEDTEGQVSYAILEDHEDEVN